MNSLLARWLAPAPVTDPYGIEASLAARKAARPARQEAARLGHARRKAHS